jgi:hypothetical protein
MNREEFERAIADEPLVGDAVREAAESGRSKQFGVLTEAAVIALMFPIARFLLTRIGLPWLSELGRYSELARRRVHEWIDERYRDEGFDPEAAEAASDALIERLEATTDHAARSAWERLVDLLRAGQDAEEGN